MCFLQSYFEEAPGWEYVWDMGDCLVLLEQMKAEIT